MFFKYIKLILFLTILIEASPKAFDSLGNELEAFQKDCHSYQKTLSLPERIRKKCKTFNTNLNKAFEFGYKLDTSIKNDNASEKQINKYHSLLRGAEQIKDSFWELTYKEKSKAREKNDVKSYGQIMDVLGLKLNSKDYKFMKEHRDVFSKHPKYIAYERELKRREKSELRRNKNLKISYKGEVSESSSVPQRLSTSQSSTRGIDKAAYQAYKRTKHFRTREKMTTTNMYVSMNARNREYSNIIDWDVTMKSIEELTGEWALLGAIAKGYHSDFVYVTMSLILRDKNRREVYRAPETKRKIYSNRQNYISYSQSYPKGLVFESATLSFGLDLEADSYFNQKNNVYNNGTGALPSRRGSLLSQVDLVNCSGYLRDNNPLKVTFFYKNRSQDKPIYWKNDVVSIDCMVYGDAGNWRNHIKGSLLGQISNKNVTNAFQDIYIDLRDSHFSHGILECSVNIYGRIFKTNNNFLMK